MNKAILAGVAFIATASSVCAQGTLSASSVAGNKPRITINGVNATATDNIFVQFLVAGATSLDGTAKDPFALTFTGNNAGLFSKSLVVNGKAPGSTVDVTVRAWDKDTGVDYATSTVKGTTEFQMVLGGVVDANGIPGLPNPIVFPGGGFTGLNLSSTVVIPEPSTYALAALGLGGLLFLRRK